MATIPPEEQLRLLLGHTSVRDFAAAHGLAEDEVEALRTDGLARLSGVLSAPPPRRRRWRRSLGLAALALVPLTAVAQLVVFQPEQPAVAAQVNGNFAQLKSWLEQKVGAVTVPGVQVSGPLSVDGGVSLNGALGASGAITGAAFTATGALSAGQATIGGAFRADAGVEFGGTASHTGTVTLGSATVFEVNGVKLRTKTTNNGSVTCAAFCNDPGREGWAGKCVGVRAGANDYEAFNCGQTAGGTLICLCAQF